MVNCSKSYPFKGASAVLYACSPPLQLSHCGRRLHINWVNTEGTNIYEDFIILRWLSWREVSLCVDSVDVESHLTSTQLKGEWDATSTESPPNVKIF
jgi:hypothetical protein